MGFRFTLFFKDEGALSFFKKKMFMFMSFLRSLLRSFYYTIKRNLRGTGIVAIKVTG